MLALLVTVAITLFAFGGAISLLLRFEDWRFGFLAALTAFVTATLAIHHVARLLDPPIRWGVGLFEMSDQLTSAFTAGVALLAVFFMGSWA